LVAIIVEALSRLEDSIFGPAADQEQALAEMLATAANERLERPGVRSREAIAST
jgi:hypothetical protein